MLKHDETQRLLDIDRLIHDLKVAHEIDGEILEVQCANIKYVNENPTSFHVFPEQSMRHLRKLQEKKEKNNLRLRRARDSIHLWHRVEKSVKAIVRSLLVIMFEVRANWLQMKQEKAEGQEDLKRMRRVLKRQEREAAAVGKKRKGTSTASGSR